MSHELPERGFWHVADRHGPAPFDLIKLDLRGKGTGKGTGVGTGSGTGTVRARNLETRLRRIRVTGPDRFVAGYDIRGHSGMVEGTVRPDGSLCLDLVGTVTGTFVAPAADPACATDPACGPTAVGALAGAMDALCRSAADMAHGAAA